MNLSALTPYIRQHRGRTFVLKIGGACLARPARLRALASEIATIEALGARVVVFHGAGPQTDELQRAAGEEPRKLHGRRVTTPAALRALRLSTSGLTGELAAALQAAGTPAVGLLAGSGGLLVAERRPPVTIDGEVVDFGAVGDVRSANPSALRALLERGLVPVLGPPAANADGELLNVNADLGAAQVAVGLGATKLVLLTDAPGVLADPRYPDSIVSTLDLAGLERLAKGGAFSGGMRVKAEAVRLALEGGVERVHVVSGLEPGALLDELYTTEGRGTLVTLDEGGSELEHVPEPHAAGALA